MVIKSPSLFYLRKENMTAATALIIKIKPDPETKLFPLFPHQQKMIKDIFNHHERLHRRQRQAIYTQIELESLKEIHRIASFYPEYYPKWYFYRDVEDMPRVSVCLLKARHTGHYVARGVALCSHTDFLSAMRGKLIAMKRALKALNGKSGKTFVGGEAEYILGTTRCNFDNHHYLDPILTPFEKMMVDHI